MPDTPLLPELARSLRSLGAPRAACDEEANDAVFAILLDARTRAGNSSREKVLAALKGEPLFARIEGAAVAAASRGVVPASRARALAAEARDILEPLKRALSALDATIPADREDTQGWSTWVEALRRVFSVADSACEGISRLLSQRDATRTSGRWFARGA